MFFNEKTVCATGWIAVCFLVTGCASSRADGSPPSNVERAMSSCAATVVGGAVLGALVGIAAKKPGQGAAIGGGIGAAACAVLLAVANEKDKEEIRANELHSLETGTNSSRSYFVDGSQRRISTVVTNAPVSTTSDKSAKSGSPSSVGQSTATASTKTVTVDQAQVCRYAETTIAVDGKGTTTPDRQLYCRSPSGAWVATQS